MIVEGYMCVNACCYTHLHTHNLLRSLFTKLIRHYTSRFLPVLQANTTRGFIQSILLTMGIMMAETY